MSPRNDNFYYQLFGGEPIELFWQGWHSDSIYLERQGWKFSASEKTTEGYGDRHLVNLAITCPRKEIILATSFIVPILDPRNPQYGHTSFDFYNRPRRLEMQAYRPNDVFREIPSREFEAFDKMAGIFIHERTFMNSRTRRLKDFKFFKQIEEDPWAKENSIYVPKKNVDELFNEILKIQFPQQQEIKKGLIMPGTAPVIQAQIFSLDV